MMVFIKLRIPLKIRTEASLKRCKSFHLLNLKNNLVIRWASWLRILFVAKEKAQLGTKILLKVKIWLIKISTLKI